MRLQEARMSNTRRLSKTWLGRMWLGARPVFRSTVYVLLLLVVYYVVTWAIFTHAEDPPCAARAAAASKHSRALPPARNVTPWHAPGGTRSTRYTLER